MSDEQNKLNSQYEELKQVMTDAARIKSDINSNCKETLKNMKQDFARFMVDNVDEDFKRICERLGLFNGFADIEDKKKREKKEISAMMNFFGKMFMKSKEHEYLKKGGKPKENTPPKCDSYALDIITNLYAARLIPEVKRALETAGIEIRFTKPITKLDLENNEDDQKTIMDYIERGANIQNEIFEKNAEIEDVIFENIPDSMKFDADSNPKGIKKAQFSALAELQAKTDELSMNGDAQKATDMVEKQCDKHFANSKNQEMLAMVSELIIAGNKVEVDEAAGEEEALGGTEGPDPTEPPIDYDMPGTETIHHEENLDNLVSEDMD